jgi:phosphoribosyl-dephospho-CoA transferase
MSERDPKQTAERVMAQFDQLTKTYVKLFNLCYDALGPGKTQAERNRVRDAIKEYIDAKGRASGKE